MSFDFSKFGGDTEVVKEEVVEPEPKREETYYCGFRDKGCEFTSTSERGVSIHENKCEYNPEVIAKKERKKEKEKAKKREKEKQKRQEKKRQEELTERVESLRQRLSKVSDRNKTLEKKVSELQETKETEGDKRIEKISKKNQFLESKIKELYTYKEEIDKALSQDMSQNKDLQKLRKLRRKITLLKSDDIKETYRRITEQNALETEKPFRIDDLLTFLEENCVLIYKKKEDQKEMLIVRGVNDFSTLPKKGYYRTTNGAPVSKSIGSYWILTKEEFENFFEEENGYWKFKEGYHKESIPRRSRISDKNTKASIRRVLSGRQSYLNAYIFIINEFIEDIVRDKYKFWKQVDKKTVDAVREYLLEYLNDFSKDGQ
jgi:hypothetical protein